jgi:RNA polymerase sigma-70 factor (family 1)
MDIIRHSDEDLLAQFKTGKQQAFNALYDRHWHPMFCVANKIVEDKEVAKDIIQDVFVNFYQRVSETEIENLKAYLFQSVKYRCFMHLRAGKISTRHLERINQITFSNSVEEEIEARELTNALDQGIATLPEKCREVFYLSRYELLSNKKIAMQLNISQKTVENQISKALKLLRNAVKKLMFMLL